MTSFKKIISLLTKAVAFISMSLLTAIVVLMFTQVIFRYVLNDALGWAEEMSRFLLIWLTFLSASLGVLHGAHLAIDYFVMKLPKNLRSVVLICTHVLNFTFLIIAFIVSFKVVGISLGSSLVSIPLNWGQAFISFPIGIALCMVFYINYIIEKKAW